MASPGAQMLLVLVLAAAAGVDEAARVSTEVGEGTEHASATSIVTGSSANLTAGHLLHGRFRLRRFIESKEFHPGWRGHGGFGFVRPGFGPHGRPLGGGFRPGMPRPGGSQFPGAGKVPSAKPGQTFPTGTSFSGQSPKHLGAGAFGDVWEATDTSTGEPVAVKVFYRKTGPSSKEYLTWNTADAALKEEMHKNIQECKLVKDIIQKGNARDPVGASRICECREEGITQGKKNKDNVMYTVWEMCGRDLTKFRQDMAALPAEKRLQVARTLTRQVLEAIAYLNIFQPALIHHDMKADNAVVLGDFDSGLAVKLIDFGCFVMAEPSNKYSQSIGDPKYMPPELTRFQAFEDPASSFDIYGAGLMHMELLCPALEDRDWCPVIRNQRTFMGQPPLLSMDTVTSAIHRRCPEMISGISSDLAAIGWLAHRSAGHRPSPSAALALEIFATASPPPIVEPVVDSGAPHVDENIRVPVVPLFFVVGDEVEYHSQTKNQWLDCTIHAVNEGEDGLGSYDLTGVTGWFKGRVPPERVRERSFSPGAHVEFAGALAATVNEYNAEEETYTLTLASGQTITSARDDVQQRPPTLEKGSKVMFADFSSFEFVPAEVRYYNAMKDCYELQFADGLIMQDVPADMVAAAE